MPTKIQIAGKLKFYSKPYGRQWKWRYQVHGKMLEPILQVPKSLENVKIIDPLHPETIPKLELPKWTPPRHHPVLESFFPQTAIRDHPNFNEKPIKLFDRSVKFHSGVEQVSLLTKTKAINGFPFKLTDTVSENDLKNQVKFTLIIISLFKLATNSCLFTFERMN
jgi:hypothetical protein